MYVILTIWEVERQIYQSRCAEAREDFELINQGVLVRCVADDKVTRIIAFLCLADEVIKIRQRAIHWVDVDVI